jgi:hypothetical protein
MSLHKKVSGQLGVSSLFLIAVDHIALLSAFGVSQDMPVPV